MKRVGLAVALAALAVYGWLALEVFRSQIAPEGFGAKAWALGPPGRALEKAADKRIEDALVALDAPGGGIDAYRQDLTAAEHLLVRSLRARPGSPRALARLAAVRWELGAPFPDGTPAPLLEMISVASRTAREAPAIQFQLGELLLNMGERPEALVHLRRSVDLDPSLSARAVRRMREQLFPAEEILQALPRRTETLAAVGQAFFDEGKQAAYLGLLEEALVGGELGLLRRYGDSCLRSGDAARLLATLPSLPPSSDPEGESERLLQRSRGELALGQLEAALADVQEARALNPGEPRILEHLGQVCMGAGDSDGAVAAFREGLGKVARTTKDPNWRARLYRQIGQAEEKRGRADRAYDAYRKAVALNPQESHAAKRLKQMDGGQVR